MSKPDPAIPSRLTRVRDGSKPRTGIYRCSCNGNEKEYSDKNVESGNTKSCSCLKRERTILCNTTTKVKHGRSRTPLYQVWAGAKQRCKNPGHRLYSSYGGRGITMCAWIQESFDNFIEAVGERPGTGLEYLIDRIDNDLGYWCGRADCADCGPARRVCNLQWSDPEESASHRRTNRIVEYKGRKQTVQRWAKELGIEAGILRERLNRGWSVDAAFETGIRRYIRSPTESSE